MTKSKLQSSKSILLFAAIAVAYFVGLGALPLLGPDEPRYAQVAVEMFERRDLITPTLGGFHWFEKPALAYWLMMAAYKLFGVNEFSARFGSALFGLLTVLTIYLLCRFVEKRNGNEQNELSFWALIVSASSVGLIVFSHAATFDIILTFPVTAALACFFVWQNPKSKIQNPKWLAGFYFFIGVALLAKGLVGAVLPFAVLFWYFVAVRKLPSKTFLLSLIWGAFVTLAVAATWYLPMYWRHGWQFVDEFFIQHHFARYTSNKYQHPEPFWFFWAILPALTLPWLPFLFARIWYLFKIQSPKPEVQNQDESPFLPFSSSPFLLCWLLVPLIFFSFSGSKLPGYILPALPAALILVAEQVRRFAAGNQRRKIILSSVAGLILISSAFAPFAFQDLAQRDSAKFVALNIPRFPIGDIKVLCLHDISHSLEFYAAANLARTADGRQIKFEGISEIKTWMQNNHERAVMVFVPLEYEYQLRETDLLETQRIKDNGAFALFLVSLK